MVSGMLAGSTSTFAGAPFDYLKVRLQTSERAHVGSVLAESRGIRAFYRGTSPALVCAVLENSVVFGANATLKRMWRSVSSKTEETLLETAMLGGLSGVFSAVAISPAETIKVRLQASKTSYSSATQCLVEVVNAEGIGALFRGLPAQLARDVLFNFVFFSSFEAFCRGIASKHGVQKQDLTPAQLVLAGGCAGASGWAVTMPFDVVKSRAQTCRSVVNENSLQLAVRISRDIYMESGVRGFFRGLPAAVARAFPVNGVLFATYSLVERVLDNL